MSDLLWINPSVALPKDELEVQFARSSGPGGQHVNKSSTKVILTFDVLHAPSLKAQLSEREFNYLISRLQKRLNKQGLLQVTVQESRSQLQNRELAEARLKKILREALDRPKPRKKTRPGRAAKEKRLQNKRRRSETKQNRKKIDY